MAGGISVDGCGMVTPFAVGTGVDVLGGASAARCPADAPYWSVPDAFMERSADLAAELKRDRACWITASALTCACEDASASLGEFPAERIALVLGSAFAGQLGMIEFAAEVRDQSPRFVSPIHFPQTVGNYVAGAMSRAFTIQGPNLTIAAGASSGLCAVAKACALLADGAADIAVAGGFEVLSEDLVRGLGGTQRGADNSGIWSEGACLYVLRRVDDAWSGGVVITDWSPRETQFDDSDDSIAYEVGRSLAAESAMRLASSVGCAEPNTEIPVRHDAVTITVRVEAA